MTVRAARAAQAGLGDRCGRLIVADNGSTDDSLEVLQRELPDAQLLANGENLGFARGVNPAIRRALELGCRYVAILNNDAVAAPGSLARAADLLDADPGLGIVGGKVLTSDGRLWFTGAKISALTGTASIPGQHEPDRGQWDLPRDVDGVTLAFAVVPRRSFDTVGLLCEDYVFGQEEWDFSHRLRLAGLRCRYDPSVQAVHDGDGSHDNADPRFVYLGYRNKLTYQARFLPRAVLVPWLAAFALYSRLGSTGAAQRRRGRLAGDAALRRRCAGAALRDALRHGRRIEWAHSASVGEATT